MADQEDVRRIALSLPEVTESEEDFAFSVPNKGKAKGIAWVWKERIHPKKARVPHPAVLVRLAAVEPDELEELLTDAWRCMAPRALVAELDEQHGR